MAELEVGTFLQSFTDSYLAAQKNLADRRDRNGKKLAKMGDLSKFVDGISRSASVLNDPLSDPKSKSKAQAEFDFIYDTFSESVFGTSANDPATRKWLMTHSDQLQTLKAKGMRAIANGAEISQIVSELRSLPAGIGIPAMEDLLEAGQEARAERREVRETESHEINLTQAELDLWKDRHGLGPDEVRAAIELGFRVGQPFGPNEIQEVRNRTDYHKGTTNRVEAFGTAAGGQEAFSGASGDVAALAKEILNKAPYELTPADMAAIVAVGKARGLQDITDETITRAVAEGEATRIVPLPPYLSTIFNQDLVNSRAFHDRLAAQGFDMNSLPTFIDSAGNQKIDASRLSHSDIARMGFFLPDEPTARKLIVGREGYRQALGIVGPLLKNVLGGGEEARGILGHIITGAQGAVDLVSGISNIISGGDPQRLQLDLGDGKAVSDPLGAGMQTTLSQVLAAGSDGLERYAGNAHRVRTLIMGFAYALAAAQGQEGRAVTITILKEKYEKLAGQAVKNPRLFAQNLAQIMEVVGSNLNADERASVGLAITDTQGELQRVFAPHLNVRREDSILYTPGTPQGSVIYGDAPPPIDYGAINDEINRLGIQ